VDRVKGAGRSRRLLPLVLLQTVWGRIEDKFWLLLHKDRQFTSPQVQFRVLLGFDPTHDGDNMDIDQNGFALLAGTKLPRSHCLCLLSWKEAPAEAGAWKICQQFDAWPSHRRMPKYAVPTPLVPVSRCPPLGIQ
jgi:hypothetical protein